MYMKHPDVVGVDQVPQEAFDRVWEPLGWVVATKAEYDAYLGLVAEGDRTPVTASMLQQLLAAQAEADRATYVAWVETDEDADAYLLEHPEAVVLVLSSATEADTTAPPIPAGLAATPGNGGAVVTCTAVDADDLAYYEWQWSTDSTFAALTGSTQTGTVAGVTISSLVNDTPYYVRARAVDTIGNASDWSASVSVTPSVAAGAPAPLFVGDTFASTTGGVNVASLDLTLSFEPEVGDDVFIWAAMSTYGLENGASAPGFTVLAYTPQGTAQAASLLHRRWQSGDSTTITVTRVGQSGNPGQIHLHALAYRNLATDTGDLLAVTPLHEVETANVATVDLGPTAAPATSKGVALFLLGGVTSQGTTTNVVGEVGGPEWTQRSTTIRTVVFHKIVDTAAARSFSATKGVSSRHVASLLVLAGQA